MINFFFYLSFSYSVDATVKQAGTKKQQKADFKPTGRQSMYGQASAPSRPTTVRQKNSAIECRPVTRINFCYFNFFEVDYHR